MGREVSGSKLPEGTLVYFWHNCKQDIVSHILPFDDCDLHIVLLFTYSNKDGLWATHYVREMWDNRIRNHPHCTLFGVLYELMKN